MKKSIKFFILSLVLISSPALAGYFDETLEPNKFTEFYFQEGQFGCKTGSEASCGSFPDITHAVEYLYFKSLGAALPSPITLADFFGVNTEIASTFEKLLKSGHRLKFVLDRNSYEERVKIFEVMETISATMDGRIVSYNLDVSKGGESAEKAIQNFIKVKEEIEKGGQNFTPAMLQSFTGTCTLF